MFDYIKCKIPLNLDTGKGIKDFSDLIYQTKDTPNQFLDEYEIRKNGTLWVQQYDTEDHSDPNAEGIMRMVGCMTRVNLRWARVRDFTGEIRFYQAIIGDLDPNRYDHGWIEWSVYLVRGKVTNRPNLIEYCKPKRRKTPKINWTTRDTEDKS